jgi:hypothetical protein
MKKMLAQQRPQPDPQPRGAHPVVPICRLVGRVFAVRLGPPLCRLAGLNSPLKW